MMNTKYLLRDKFDTRNAQNRQIPYIPGNYSSREGDWFLKRGKMDYAGYGFIRPSPHGRVK